MTLAPLAAAIAAIASASTVEMPTQQGQGGSSAIIVPGTNGDASTSLNPSLGLSGPSLSGGLNASPTPGLTLQPGGGAVNLAPGQNPGGSAVKPAVNQTIPKGGALKAKPEALNVVRPAAFKSTNKGANVPGGIVPGAAEKGPAANRELDETITGIQKAEADEANGGGNLSIRQALDRAYDRSMSGGDVSGSGAGANSVAGKFASTADKIESMVKIANAAPSANAPALYEAAISEAEKSLPAAAADAVKKVVLGFAARKADPALKDLVPATFEAAAAGQKGETTRLVKGLDKWEGLLGSKSAPLLANLSDVKTAVAAALDAAISGSKASAPRVFVTGFRGAYKAENLPGSVPSVAGAVVAKVPALAANWAIKPSDIPSDPVGAAYREYLANPGAGSTYRARRMLAASVPSAALSAANYWLKDLAMRAWSFLRSLVTGGMVPSVADASTTPRLKAAATLWKDAAVLGGAAATAASQPRLTVARARGAFALATKAAAAHEALTGESGASAQIASLSDAFESAASRLGLSPADVLPAGLEALVSGPGGLAHWASRHAQDARERGADAFARVKGSGSVVTLEDGPATAAANALVAASKGMTATAFGEALWASGFGPAGRASLSAELRSTERGGSISVTVERSDEKLAAALDALGFSVVPSGKGFKAILDAQTASLDAEELSAAAAEASALVAGVKSAPTHSFGGLQRLLADVKKAPGDAKKAAQALDGRSWLSRARPLALVGDLHAYSAEVPTRDGKVLVFALRDDETGLTQYARAERLDGAPVPPAAFAALLRAK